MGKPRGLTKKSNGTYQSTSTTIKPIGQSGYPSWSSPIMTRYTPQPNNHHSLPITDNTQEGESTWVNWYKKKRFCRKLCKENGNSKRRNRTHIRAGNKGDE